MGFKLLQLTFFFYIWLQLFYNEAAGSWEGVNRIGSAFMNRYANKLFNIADTVRLLTTPAGKDADSNGLNKFPDPRIMYILPPGIDVGRYVNIKLYVPPDVDSFLIDFQSPSNDNIEFHLSINLLEQTAIFNTFRDKKWQEPEDHSLFGDLKKMDITITLKEDGFEIFINNFDYEFDYRIPKEDLRLDALVIRGAVWVFSIQLGQESENLTFK